MKTCRVIIPILILIIALSVVLTGCTPYFSKYFNEFSSVAAFTQATETLVLPDNTYIGEYMGDDKYTVYKKHSSFDSYGIATSEHIIVSPDTSTQYGYIAYVVDIRDDIAIVVKAMYESNTLVYRMGAILLAGENLSSDIVGFNYYCPTTTFDELDATACPIRLVGDYICVLGDVETHGESNKISSSTVAGTITYYTFYKYNTDSKKLEEQFRIKDVTTATAFDSHDTYVVRYDNYNTTYKAFLSVYFYRAIDKAEDGYVEFVEKWTPYSETALTSYWDTSTSTANYLDVSVYYLGAGTYLRKASFMRSAAFDGYTMAVPGESSPLSLDSYAVMKSDRLNISSGKKTYSNTNLYPYEVVNQYNEEDMRSLVNYYNNVLTVTSDETGGNPIYQFPYYSTASLTQENLSLVYTYYFPYAGDTSLPEEQQKLVFISYVLFNNLDMSEQIRIEDTYMPTVFVDKVGFESYSVDFDDKLVFDAETWTLNYKLNSLQNYINTDTERKVYKTYVYHSDYAIVGELDAKADTDTFKKGAYYFKNPKKATLTIPYKYDELTPFFGSYATGAIWDKSTKTTKYYRIDSNGTETELNNVYYLRNGVYVSRALQLDGSYLYALFSNEGTVLMGYNASSLKLFEQFLTDDGKFVSTVAVATIGNHDCIYKLN